MYVEICGAPKMWWPGSRGPLRPLKMLPCSCQLELDVNSITTSYCAEINQCRNYTIPMPDWEYIIPASSKLHLIEFSKLVF